MARRWRAKTPCRYATGVSTNSFQDSAVTSGTTYYYRVTAVDAGGESALSNETHSTFVAPVATIPSPVPNVSVVPVNSLQIAFNEPVSGFTRSSLSLTLNGGANLLTPSQTLTTSDNQTYTLNNLSSLTTPVGTYSLSFTAAGSGVSDAVGNTASSNAGTTFVVTHAAPQIAAVYVSGSAWQQSFLNYLASSGQGDAQLGYQDPGRSKSTRIAPVDEHQCDFDPIHRGRDDQHGPSRSGLDRFARSRAGPRPSAATFSYSSATRTATWSYGTPLPLDKYLISIPSAAVTNGLGADLDGEWTNATSSYPSGNGTAGGDFDFRFNILPGDVDQNGVVTGIDGGDVRQHFMQFPTSPGYSPLYDTYGKGAITGVDLLAVQAALLTQLPATDPAPPPAQGGVAPSSIPDSGPVVAAGVAASPAVMTAGEIIVSFRETAAASQHGISNFGSGVQTLRCRSGQFVGQPDADLHGAPVADDSGIAADDVGFIRSGF